MQTRECYLAFLFHGKNEDENAGLHVTHVYLGHLSDHYIEGVKQMVNDYFSFYGKQKVLPISFNIEDFFQENHRVLLCGDTNAFNGFSILRGIFVNAGFHKSRFRLFKPHISVHKNPEIKEINNSFKFYSLVADKKIVHEWGVL